MNDEKIKRLITLYELIIHGNEKRFGLFNCYDTYYAGGWDDLLGEVETIKDELNNTEGQELRIEGRHKDDGESDDPGTDIAILMGR